MKEMEKLNDQELESVSGGITEEDAVSRAMKKARIKKADFQKVELDYEHGRKIYEIKLYKNGIEYEFDIDYKTGDILKFEKDYDD